MDSIIDKLLEAIKDKMNKKQVIAIVGMIVLAMYKPVSKAELVVIGCITLIAIVAISWQGHLDGGKKNETEANGVGVYGGTLTELSNDDTKE